MGLIPCSRAARTRDKAMPLNVSRALRRASCGAMPFLMFSRIRQSRWNCSKREDAKALKAAYLNTGAAQPSPMPYGRMVPNATISRIFPFLILKISAMGIVFGVLK
jgi:hypothetical protein